MQDIGDDCYGRHDEFDDVDYYGEELVGMRCHGTSRNYGRVRDHCHYSKYS